MAFSVMDYSNIRDHDYSLEIKRIDRELTYLIDQTHYHEVMLEGLIEKRKVN